jgi:hypothetical protein
VNWTAHVRRSAQCACLLLLGSLGSGDIQAQSKPQATALSKAQLAQQWNQIAMWPDFWQGSWQSVSPIADDYNAEPQYTAAAKEYIRTYKPAEDTPFANCQAVGMPFVMNIGGMPMKFFPTPGMIALYIESSGMTRFIHTDGRAHSARTNPSYLGESIGHWEGDTLVVDTTGLDPKTLFQMGKQTNRNGKEGDFSPVAGVIFGQHGPNLRLVERMHLVDLNTLEIQLTVYDDTVFAQPVTLPARRFIRGIEPRNDPQEWACTDNRDRLDPNGKLEIGVKNEAGQR